jgi:hypothetical protein
LWTPWPAATPSRCPPALPLTPCTTRWPLRPAERGGRHQHIMRRQSVGGATLQQVKSHPERSPERSHKRKNNNNNNSSNDNDNDNDSNRQQQTTTATTTTDNNNNNNNNNDDDDNDSDSDNDSYRQLQTATDSYRQLQTATDSYRQQQTATATECTCTRTRWSTGAPRAMSSSKAGTWFMMAARCKGVAPSDVCTSKQQGMPKVTRTGAARRKKGGAARTRARDTLAPASSSSLIVST